MPAWKCSGCGALTMRPEDPTTHLPNCPNMEALRRRSVPESVLTAEPDDTASPIDAGIVVAEALTEILADSDPEPDSPADSPFDGFGGGETGGGGAGGNY